MYFAQWEKNQPEQAILLYDSNYDLLKKTQF